jgi:NAD(P)-dependent dehydrogenase (short-subunit alcohol dehydrogenase family)
VTGGASGIGRAAALLLGEDGYNVTVADRDAAGGEETAALVNRSGSGRAHFIATDVADEASVKAMVASAVATYGRLDGAINSAGVEGTGVQLHLLSLEAWNRHIQINLTGVFLCVKHQLAPMLEQGGGGSIVCVSSAAALMGLPVFADYCASKAGVTGLVRSAAVDYATSGIRVNAILPGRTETPMAARIRGANIPALGGPRPLPMERGAQPFEIATSAVWLLSDQASYITGASLSVDGGMAIA